MFQKIVLVSCILSCIPCYAMEKEEKADFQKYLPTIFECFENNKIVYGGDQMVALLVRSCIGRKLILNMRGSEIFLANAIETQNTKGQVYYTGRHYFGGKGLLVAVDSDRKERISCKTSTALVASTIAKTENLFLTINESIKKEISSQDRKLFELSRMSDMYLLYKTIASDGDISKDECNNILYILKSTSEKWPPQDEELKKELCPLSAYTVLAQAYELRKKNKIDEKDWGNYTEEWHCVQKWKNKA